MESPNVTHLEPTNADLSESLNISLLKQEVENTLGRKILSSADCHYLQSNIFQQLQFTLSFNTLRRFFRLMEAKYQQSVYTLDILCKYCGFSSFNDFVNSKKQSQPINVDPQSSALINYLILIFKSTEVKNLNDSTYQSLVSQTIHFLEHQPYLFHQFQREIARTKNGQDFYFEKFINIDKLNSYYGEGLRYYLHEKRTRESQIFGHSFLCLRYWLTNNNDGVEDNFKKIMQYDVDRTTPAIIAGCFFASQVYHSNLCGGKQEPILSKARQLYSLIKPIKDNHSLLFQFEMLVAQSLILTAQYEDALFYVGEAIKRRKNNAHADVDPWIFETLDLFHAIARAHLGATTTARDILACIEPNNFHFLHKQYLTILYLSLKQSFQKNNYRQEQIEDLINRTGFTNLSHCFKKG